MATHAGFRREKQKGIRTKNHQKRLTVAEYLLKRLSSAGVSHLFSIEHASLERLQFYAEKESKIHYMQLPDSIACSHIADGYSRSRGIGAVALTKDMPGFIDCVMRASFDSVPLIVIFGTRATHHWQDYIEKGLRELTCGWTVLDDASSAAKKIDRIIEYCIHYQKPVCIELVQEIADELIPPHQTQKIDFPLIDQNSLEDFLLDLDEMLSKAKHPVVYAGHQIAAHKLQDELHHFLKRYNIPLLSHANHDADLLLVLAENVPPGAPYRHIVQIRHDDAYCDDRQYGRLFFKDVVEGLSYLECRKTFKSPKERIKATQAVERILEVTSCQLISSFSDLCLPVSLYSPTYPLAASLGAKLAKPNLPLLCVIGEKELENALQMLQVADTHKIGLVICVMEHETKMRLSEAYSWHLSELAHLFVDGNAIQVDTFKAFEKALNLALQPSDDIFLIDCFI